MCAPVNAAPHRVVVVGSGFGGLFATKALRRSDVEVTLVARTAHHLFQPLLYQVATGILSEGEIAPSTRIVLRDQRNANVLVGDVTDIDPDTRTVTSVHRGRVTVTPYDSVIVAAGAGQSYFGNDRFAEFAPGMKTLDDALELRGRIMNAFDAAELATDPAERARLLTFVVVGAGPTGVEMAGQIAELSKRTLAGTFRTIDPRDARIVLLDAAPKVLPPFADSLGEHARRRLESLGVEVTLNAAVTDVDTDGLVVRAADGTEHRIEAATKVWSAGVSASPLGAMLASKSDAEIDRAGRVLVNPDLTVPGLPNVFVVGDMMALDGLPGVAQVAIQGGRYAARVIADEVKAAAEGRPVPERRPFRYRDKGSMATVSRFSAVAQVGPVKITGFLAWLMWLVVHVAYVVGFKSRLTTVCNWAWTFLGRTRTQLTVTHQQTEARLALGRLVSLEDARAARETPVRPEQLAG